MSEPESPRDAAREELRRHGLNPDHRAPIVPRPGHDDPDILEWIADMNELVSVVHADQKNS